MTLADSFRAGIDKIYSVAGVSCSYTERNKSARTVTAVIDYDLGQYGDSVEVSKAVASISVRVSEVEYTPRQGDTFEVNNTTFVVDSPVQSDELEHTVLVS